jgi:hypothetical protein
MAHAKIVNYQQACMARDWLKTAIANGITRLYVADFGLFSEFRPRVQQMRTFRQYNGNDVLAGGLDELGNMIILTRAGNYQLSGDELNLVK